MKVSLPVVVLSTSVSATSGMLSVLADAAVTVGHVAAKLPGLLLVGRHLKKNHDHFELTTITN